MLRVLEVTFPVFMLVFCGYFGQRLRALPDNAIDGINAFVFNFALPAMLYRVVSSQPAESFANLRFIAGYGACDLVVFLGVRALLMRQLGSATARARATATGFGLTAALTNAGYLGIPLILEIGERYAPTLILAIICDIFLVISTSIVLLEVDRRRTEMTDTGALPLATVAKSIASSPLVLAIGAGLITSLLEFKLPDAAGSFVRILSGAAGPCALFAIGASLGGKRIAMSRGVQALVATKLLVHPALVAAVLLWVVRTDPITTAVGIFAASLPCASNAFIIAQRYGADVREISSAILLSTFAALGTVSFVIWATGLR